MRAPIGLCLWALPLALTLIGSARAEPEASPVVVTLRASAGVTGATVRVSHVASLSGGSTALRERSAETDLAARPARGQPLTLLAELVAYRIRVAGIDRSRFSVQGAAAVQVNAAGAVSEDDLLQAARDALRDRIPGRAADVVVTLAQPV